MSEIENLIRKSLISLIIYNAEGTHRTDLLGQIQDFLEQSLIILTKEPPCQK